MNDLFFTAALISIEVLFSLMVLKALRNAGAKYSVLRIVGVVFALWLATIYVLLSQGFFSSTGMPQLAFSLGIFIPVVVGYLAKLSWKPLGHAIEAMPTKSFLLLQHMRAAFGIMFFFATAVTAWFQFVGGLGDISVGVGAFLALNHFRKHPDKERQAIIQGNLMGILDFMVVLNVGVFVVLQNQSPDDMFSLIPLYVVPIFILLHIFSLQRFRKTGVGLIR